MEAIIWYVPCANLNFAGSVSFSGMVIAKDPTDSFKFCIQLVATSVSFMHSLILYIHRDIHLDTVDEHSMCWHNNNSNQNF